MKTRELIIGIVIGFAVGFFICHELAGRFRVVAIADGTMVKIDTFTGESWVSVLNSGWRRIPEIPNQNQQQN